MKGGLDQLMKQAQKLQQDMQKAQEDLVNLEVEGQAGGSMVKVIMNGKHQVRRVHIDENLLSEDRDMLEDMIAAAVNDAVQKVEKASQDKMANMTSGLPLPPGFKLPF